jgi:hypothetical protein
MIFLSNTPNAPWLTQQIGRRSPSIDGSAHRDLQTQFMQAAAISMTSTLIKSSDEVASSIGKYEDGGDYTWISKPSSNHRSRQATSSPM